MYIVNCNLEPLLLFSLWGQPIHTRRTIINVVIHKQQFNVLLETNKVFLNEKKYMFNNHIRSLIEVSYPHIFKICDAQSVLIHESQISYVNMWILIGTLATISCTQVWNSFPVLSFEPPSVLKFHQLSSQEELKNIKKSISISQVE